MPKKFVGSIELTKQLYEEKIGTVNKKIKALSKRIEKREEILKAQENERTELEQLLSELMLAQQRI
jgi:prefoldin subunit 5